MLGSVRARAAAGATVVVALALIAAGTAVLLVLRGNLQEQAGLQAEVAAREVAAQIATGTPYAGLDLPDGEDHPVVVADDDGRVLTAGEDVRAVDGKPVRGAQHGAQGAGPGTSGDDDDDDRSGLKPGEVDDDVAHRDGTANVDGKVADYRFAVVEAKDTRGGKATVRAGAALAPEQEAVGSVRTAMLIGLPLLCVVVAGVTWLVTRRALRPVEGIRGEMAAITASTDLSRRVPVPPSQDEVGRLARTTNETLAALESSVERQRRFVADASHELRSPIASLRTQLEVGVAHPELLDVPGAVEDTVRLQRLAADLLLLARLDAGERPADARVDLAAMVREESSQRVADRVPVHVGELAGAEVAGSRSQLARVLGNLLDNAQRHAVGSVRVAVVREGEWVVLQVEDDGPGVPEGERERIFERFVRLDDARARDDGGAGLGLAIARDVAVRHGGSLGVRTGSVFALRLPVVG
ncbi:Signal transduction histidine kinase [Streptomyces sp. 2112.3]|nr:signal transduction histidine kinase [Streptomyces sp. 2321.6]SDR21809.1 Signal transduction histidine kinase [Streptomyces sp. KS_16]SED56282.1 Signal transduction histidine kinase [Streptomyces sp. 2133.1]SEE28486.1 Signal transduction histidine kinase [Streptomyces sp. 2112.3]SNC71136.1 Signal transduction histidine kinase [Streptomyces sp. 2114.4]